MNIVQQTERMDDGVDWLARLGSGDKDFALCRQTMPTGMFSRCTGTTISSAFMSSAVAIRDLPAVNDVAGGS